jgi:hypothetical protein
MRLRANTPLHGDREKPGAERAAAGDFDPMFLPNAPAEVYQLKILLPPDQPADTQELEETCDAKAA